MYSEHHTIYSAASEHLIVAYAWESTDVLQDKAGAVLSSKRSIILKCKKKKHDREHIWINTEN